MSKNKFIMTMNNQRNDTDRDAMVGCPKFFTRLIALFYMLSVAFTLANAQTIAHVNQTVQSPTFVNIYWDNSWDVDNPQMRKITLDTLTQAITHSSYFQGLAEYGVQSASFAGGFLPDSHCSTKAPNRVGFYDPFNTAIAGFIQCEHDHGPLVFRQSGVIYNIILPPSSLESDFWSQNFCSGPGSPAAWHYHGLQNNFFGGPPVYTVVQSNAQCGGNVMLLDSLTHEMVEATTDPFPVDISIIPPHINVLSSQNEIADICEQSSVPLTAFGTQTMVAPYWSNAQQKCLSFPQTLDNSVFDAEFYLNLYPDLRAAFGSDEVAALNHWLIQGLPVEGRRASREFDVQFYLNHYGDLKAFFGENFEGALQHWLNQGLPNEGRRGSREFDVQFYLAHYGDLAAFFGTNFSGAVNHWLNQGLPNEGRAGANEVDVSFYLGYYGDLKAAFGANFRAALDHWVRQGLPNEGRRGSLQFDVRYYLATYPDLRAAFGTNYTEAFDHWVNTGIKEGRRGAP
jgi:hypothetical protein